MGGPAASSDFDQTGAFGPRVYYAPTVSQALGIGQGQDRPTLPLECFSLLRMSVLPHTPPGLWVSDTELDLPPGHAQVHMWVHPSVLPPCLQTTVTTSWVGFLLLLASATTTGHLPSKLGRIPAGESLQVNHPLVGQASVVVPCTQGPLLFSSH